MQVGTVGKVRSEKKLVFKYLPSDSDIDIKLSI